MKVWSKKKVEPDLMCFAGHFPGNPLVPGALMLAWLVAEIEKNLSCKVGGVKQIKFLAPLRPGDTLSFAFDDSHADERLNFQLHSSAEELDSDPILIAKGSVVVKAVNCQVES